MASEKNYSPWVDPSLPKVFGAAWVMLADSTSTLYAQLGWIEYAGGVRRLFSEAGNATTGNFNIQYYNPTPAINSVTTVEVSYQPNNNDRYDYYVNGTIYGAQRPSRELHTRVG